jgi:hypothetical protein
MPVNLQSTNQLVLTLGRVKRQVGIQATSEWQALITDALYQFATSPQFNPSVEVDAVRWALDPDHDIRLQEVAGSNVQVIKHSAVMRRSFDGGYRRGFAIMRHMQELSLFITAE